MKHIVQAVTVRWYNACAYYALALSQGLKVLGNRVTVASGYESPAVQRARQLQIDVFDTAGLTSRTLFSYITLAGAYRSFVLENNVTLVNVHHGSDHAIWAFALRGTGIPLVRTSGNRIPPQSNMFSRYVVTKKTAGIIASCGTVRKYYTDAFDIAPEEIPVINGGVDSDYYVSGYPHGSLRDDIGIPDEAFVFGILARYSPDKGHRDFFKAAEIVAKKHMEAWFLVAGWSAQLTENDMHLMAERAGILERTRFIGRYPDSRDLIGAVDTGVIASINSETVCRIAMEYMAMGVPVIATDTNVIPEVVRHGQSGIVVPAGDSEKMASAMRQMLTSKEKALMLGKCGRRIVERDYSLASFAEKTLDAYRSLTGYE